MITKYAVYDAQTGISKLVDTKEEAVQAFWKHVVQFALVQFHNNMYTTVEIDDSGNQTWKNEGGQEVQCPYTEQEVLDLLAKNRAELNSTQ